MSRQGLDPRRLWLWSAAPLATALCGSPSAYKPFGPLGGCLINRQMLRTAGGPFAQRGGLWVTVRSLRTEVTPLTVWAA